MEGPEGTRTELRETRRGREILQAGNGVMVSRAIPALTPNSWKYVFYLLRMSHRIVFIDIKYTVHPR